MEFLFFQEQRPGFLFFLRGSKTFSHWVFNGDLPMYIDLIWQKEMVGLGTRPLGEGSTVTETLMGREGDTLQRCACNRGPTSGAPVKRGDHIPEAH